MHDAICIQRPRGCCPWNCLDQVHCSGCCPSVHHFSNTKYNFTALKTPCTSPPHFPPLPHKLLAATHLIVSIDELLQIPCSRNLTESITFSGWLLSLSDAHFHFPMSFCGSMAHFFFFFNGHFLLWGTMGG